MKHFFVLLAAVMILALTGCAPSVYDLLSALLNIEKTTLFQQKIHRYGFK